MMVKIVIGAVILMVWFLAAAARYEREHPCLEYGPERLQYMQKVGNAYVPVYGRDCLRRAP